MINNEIETQLAQVVIELQNLLVAQTDSKNQNLLTIDTDVTNLVSNELKPIYEVINNNNKTNSKIKTLLVTFESLLKKCQINITQKVQNMKNDLIKSQEKKNKLLSLVLVNTDLGTLDLKASAKPTSEQLKTFIKLKNPSMDTDNLVISDITTTSAKVSDKCIYDGVVNVSFTVKKILKKVKLSDVVDGLNSLNLVANTRETYDQLADQIWAAPELKALNIIEEECFIRVYDMNARTRKRTGSMFNSNLNINHLKQKPGKIWIHICATENNKLYIGTTFMTPLILE